MGSFFKVPSKIGSAMLIVAIPAVTACSGTADSSQQGSAEDSSQSEEFTELSSEPQEETERRSAEAEALVDDQLVDDVVARYPYPLPADAQLSDEHRHVSADEAQWHEELVEYWEEFPYDEVASAYGCEIHGLQINDSGEGDPTRNYGIDCETPEDSEALSATIDRIETEAAEITRSEASDVADSHD